MILTPARIIAVFPRCSLLLAEEICAAMPDYRIETPARAAAFLGQVGHESGGLYRLVENLNYSAKGLAAIWPNRYAESDGSPNELALRLARNPQAIANNCYANRMGNGDEASGDGWRFRGRGLIQMTGRANYDEALKAIGLDRPEELEQPYGAARSACWFWKRHGLNDLADADQYLRITRKINGGTHGHAERVALRRRILQVITQ